MRSGQIIETGDPKKIYFGAETSFVADFIGRSNLIPAVVGAEDEKTTVIDSKIGKLKCRKSGFHPGAEVTLCLRPEFIRPGRDIDAAAVNRIQGTVETLLFIGDAYEVEIKVGETLLLAHIDPGTDIKAGDTAVFQIQPEHCLIVAKQDE